MSSGIEYEIHQLLNAMGEPAQVADEMIKKWHREELSEADLELVAHFLLRFGFYAALCENLAIRLKDGGKIPWSVVGPILKYAPEKPRKEEVDKLLIGAGEQGGLEDLCRSKGLEAIDPRFQKIQAQTQSDRIQKNKKLRETLLEQADLLHNDRLFEKEKEVLRQLLEIYPDDAEVRERFAEFSTEQARSKLARAADWAEQEDHYHRQSMELSEELKAVSDKLLKKVKKKAKKDPQIAYDAALGLFQMGNIEGAIEVLLLSPKERHTMWLLVDLYLESHRYLMAMTEIDKLEKVYAEDPEVVPAAMLARARALWGMRQYELAVNLLEKLVQAKPDYRSAHSLLTHWKEALE